MGIKDFKSNANISRMFAYFHQAKTDLSALLNYTLALDQYLLSGATPSHLGPLLPKSVQFILQATPAPLIFALLLSDLELYRNL